MNPVNRARIILALKTLAALAFIAFPLNYLLADKLEFSLWQFFVELLEGAVVAVALLAQVIIVEAAHWYISSKEGETED